MLHSLANDGVQPDGLTTIIGTAFFSCFARAIASARHPSTLHACCADFSEAESGSARTAVAPGPVATELFLNGKGPELLDRMAKMNPLERLGEPEDIARVVSFLAGPDGAWINGQIVRANGGMC